MNAAVRGLVLGIVLAIIAAGCVVKRVMAPRLTGTCTGACDHYLACKSGGTPDDRDRCNSECPGVFSDSESLMAYESLSCADAVEYVDGSAPKSAERR